MIELENIEKTYHHEGLATPVLKKVGYLFIFFQNCLIFSRFGREGSQMFFA